MVHMDYAFSKSKDMKRDITKGSGEKEDEEIKEDEKGMPILIMKEDWTGNIFANVVPQKGNSPYAIKRAAMNIKNLGFPRIIFKSDGEGPILALKNSIRREVAMDGVGLVMEESPPRGTSEQWGR